MKKKRQTKNPDSGFAAIQRMAQKPLPTTDRPYKDRAKAVRENGKVIGYRK